MDFLENVKNVVGSAAQTVAKRSGEVVEISKIKYSMYGVKGEIRDLKEGIGGAVYDSYKNNTPLDEIVKEKCARIDVLIDQLHNFEEQLKNYKSMVKCPQCGKSVKDDYNFCPVCGAKLAVDKEAKVSGQSGEQEYYTPPQSDFAAQDEAEEKPAE